MNRFCILPLFFISVILLFPTKNLFGGESPIRTKFTFRDLVCDKNSKITVLPLFSDEAKKTLESLLAAKYREPVLSLLKQYARCIVNERMRYLGIDYEPRGENILERTKLVIKYGAKGLIGIELYNPRDIDKDWEARATLLLLKDGVVVDANFVLEYIVYFDEDVCHRDRRFPMFYGSDQLGFMQAISVFKELKSLQFFFGQRPEGLKGLKNLSQLESLSLRFDKLPENLSEFIAAMPKLQSVWVTIADEESEYDENARKIVSDFYTALADLRNLRVIHLRGKVFQHDPKLQNVHAAEYNVEGNISFRPNRLKVLGLFDDCQMLDYRVPSLSFYEESQCFEGISIKSEKHPVSSEEARQTLASLFDPKYREAALQVLDGVVETLVAIPCEARGRPVEEWKDKTIAGMNLCFDHRSTGACRVSIQSDFGLGEGNEGGSSEGSETELFIVQNGSTDRVELATEYCFGGATDHRIIAVNNKMFLDGLSGLTCIKSLHLNFGKTIDETLVPLANLTNLEEVKFEVYEIPKCLPEIIAKLPSLRTFHVESRSKDKEAIEKESFQVDEILESLLHCPELQRLHLAGCVAKTGRSLPKLRALASLTMPVANDEVMKHIGLIPNLRKLELLPTKSKWEDYGGCYSNESLANLASLRQLKSIAFSNTELSLQYLPPLPELDSVEIANAFLAGADMARLGRSRNIRYMTLYSVTIPEDDERYFAAFQNLRALECSAVRNSFERFPCLPKLEKLSISGNVTDEGVNALLKSPKLSSLSISSNAISNDAQKKASQRYSIQYLNIYKDRHRR